MGGIRQLLETRRAELLHEMEPLEAQAVDLRTNLAKTDNKLKAMTKEIAEIDKALQAISKERLETKVSIKEAILQLLADSPSGLDSPQLLAALNDRFFDGKLARTSMSPQLTRLKNDDHKIKYRGDKWFLA
jgi:septal ring factor EnvC (AmiA/AmiB activator)